MKNAKESNFKRDGAVMNLSVSDVIIKNSDGVEIINTIRSQVLDINLNRTILAIKFGGEYEVINNAIENLNKGISAPFKVTMNNCLCDRNSQLVENRVTELGEMRVVKYFSLKESWDSSNNGNSSIVIFVKPNIYNFDCVDDEETRYIIRELNKNENSQVDTNQI